MNILKDCIFHYWSPDITMSFGTHVKRRVTDCNRRSVGTNLTDIVLPEGSQGNMKHNEVIIRHLSLN